MEENRPEELTEAELEAVAGGRWDQNIENQFRGMYFKDVPVGERTSLPFGTWLQQKYPTRWQERNKTAWRNNR